MAGRPESLSPIVVIDGIDRYQPPMEEVRGLAWSLGEAVMRSSFDVSQLVAITRGGLTPTDCISRSMGIRDIQTLAVELYEPNSDPQGDPEVPLDEIRVFQTPKLRRLGRGALFVDDVLDKGRTLEFVRENWPQAATATVYTKQDHHQTAQLADFYGKYVGNIWVDFPWEVEAATRRNLRQSPGRVLFN